MLLTLPRKRLLVEVLAATDALHAFPFKAGGPGLLLTQDDRRFYTVRILPSSPETNEPSSGAGTIRPRTSRFTTLAGTL
jgi:hypothetical protein